MIETRKTEIRFTTSDPKQMLGKFTTSRIYKTWIETAVDDKGNVQNLDRNQLLFDKGIYISNDVLSEIKFWMDSGDIKEIEVSNQNRMASIIENTRMFPFRAVAVINDKKHSFLLYAMSVQNALDVLNDYVELNFSGGFYISDLKMLDFCVILVDKLKSVKQRNIELDVAYLNDEISMDEYKENKLDEPENDFDDEADDLKLKFYQIGAKIVMRLEDNPDEEYNQTFIVHTFSAVRANLIIEKYLRDRQEERYLESLKNPDNKFVKKQISSFIEESKIINVGGFIPKLFSEAYQEEMV